MRAPVAASSMTLLIRAQQGDERARDELCARYLPRLRRWAHGRLPGWARDHLDTEDIVQDTFLNSIRKLDSFAPRHEQAFCAYLCQAIRNRSPTPSVVPAGVRRAKSCPPRKPPPIRLPSSLRLAAKRPPGTTKRCSG